MQREKQCTKCGETKPLDGFYRKKEAADGRRAECKECWRERSRRYHEENREKVLDRQRRYREENREENRDERLEYARRYHKENLGKWREYNRRYREENREKVLEHKRRYRKENRDIINQELKSRRAQHTRVSNLLASKKGDPYSPEEDALILADNGMTTYQKAIELGRTYASVETRKRRLRSRANH